MIRIETSTQFCEWGSAGPEHSAGQRDRRLGSREAGQSRCGTSGEGAPLTHAAGRAEHGRLAENLGEDLFPHPS